jgi:hypothetical protein
VVDLLRQYGRAFIGEEQAEDFAQGVLGLERSWEGPLATNETVDRTLARLGRLEASAGPELLSNWRFQQALYRAYYDSFIRRRLIRETYQERVALEQLGRYPAIGTLAAIGAANGALSPPSDSPHPARVRVSELAEDLFVSIRMQLSVPLYDAIAVDRGANLDTVDVPLNDRLWLRDQLAAIRRLHREEDRVRAIEAVLHRTDPGPGGFYDDLGDLRHQPHLVRGEAFASDPDFRRSSLVGFGSRAGWPLAWCQNAQTLYDAPLQMHYDELDRTRRYKVRVVYAGDSFRNRIRLDAGSHEVHGWFQKPNPPAPIEFDVPPQATADGKLTLTWHQEPGKGANGRGCQVAEVWLMRK